MRNKRHAVFAASVVAGAALGIFAIGNADAQSSSPPIELTWNAPPGCSDSAAILKEVATLRGNHASAPEQMKAVANVSLDPSGVWNLQITTQFSDGTHGERQIQAESCKAAAEATASILALAITTRAQEVATAPTAALNSTNLDASAPAQNEIADASAPTPPTTTTSSTDAGARDASPPIEEPPPKSPSTPIPFHPYFGASVGGTVGDLPTIGLGGGGDFGVMLGLLRAEAYANYWAFARARFSTPGGANFQMFSAGLRTCVSVGDTISVGPCAAFELGSMSAQSFDVTHPSSGSALTSDGFLGALGTLSLAKNRLISLRALLEFGATFQRPTFVLDGAHYAYQPGPLVGRGTFGAEIRF